MTKVIFRKWNDNGDVIAMFPEIPTDLWGFNCQSYEHIGQHGGAVYDVVLEQTTLATPEEYDDLKKEIEEIGYNDLEVVTRESHKMRMERISRAYEIGAGKVVKKHYVGEEDE